MSLSRAWASCAAWGSPSSAFFAPKATVRWPEQPADVAPKFRGRLQLLYDEYGTLKCETCFQCAQACPIECIDMGGMDTKGRFHVHWGPPETYGERREESALRRSGRHRAGPAFERFDPSTSAARRHPRAPRPRPQGAAPDPRGDAGRVRLPAGRRAQAHLADDGRVVRDDLRHRDLLPPPAVRAAGRRGGPAGDGPPRGSSRPTARRWTRRSGYGGGAGPMSAFLPTPRDWPAILTGPRRRPRGGPRRPGRGDEGRRVRGPPDRRPRPGRHRDDRDDRRLGAARPRRGRLPTGEKWRAAASQPAGPALRRRQRLRRRSRRAPTPR